MTDEERCIVHNCATRPMDQTSIPICFNHLHEVGAAYARLYDIVFSRGISYEETNRHASQMLAEKRATNGVVYYIRLGDHIKIGTSVDVWGRMRALYVTPDALLATEPGSYALEAERHRDFVDERIDKGRELFNPSPRLLLHINNLRAKAGQEPLNLAA